MDSPLINQVSVRFTSSGHRHEYSSLAAPLYLQSTSPGARSSPTSIVYSYGGGVFVVDSAFTATHFRFFNSLMAAAGVVAVSVDYRLTPEHLIPVAYDDAWAALNWT
ncbi:hypothetical protein ABZP36_025489, partial [Zizania latifolia]